MPRGGYRPGAGRPKGTRSTASDAHADTAGHAWTPLEYMLAVMNDASTDPMRRDRMAIAAAPYVHGKKGEVGKREQRKARSETAEQGSMWEDLLQGPCLDARQN